MTKHEETQHPPAYMTMDQSTQMRVTRALLPITFFLMWASWSAFFLITGLMS